MTDQPRDIAASSAPPSPTRRKRRVVIISVASVALIGIGAAAGGGYEYAHWAPLYEKATHDLASERKAAADFQQLATSEEQQLTALNDKVSNTVGDLDHPSFVLWNSCAASGPAIGCPLTPGKEYVGGVPDTFTYQIDFHATVPVETYLLPASHYACWYTRACPWGGVGAYWAPTTALHAIFHDAEGCASYLAIFKADQVGSFYPDIRVTRNPARHPTGVCA